MVILEENTLLKKVEVSVTEPNLLILIPVDASSAKSLLALSHDSKEGRPYALHTISIMRHHRYLFFLTILCVSNAWVGSRSAPSTFTKLSSEPSDAAEKLRQEAAKLRQEVDSFEQSKREAENNERRLREQEKEAAAAQRERYSAVVPILKPDGTVVDERCDFAPRHRDGASYITTCLASLPLGIILGESEDFVACTVIDEVAEGSNGQAAGLEEGDIVRAFTACQMTMETPTWQIIAGGIGIPKIKRFMFSADGQPFETVMEAVGSNRQDPEERPMVIVIERRDEP